MLNAVLALFFLGLNSQEQNACFKAIECSVFSDQEIKNCTHCVNKIYVKYQYSIPFTKRQVFDYISNLSCKELKDKIQYYEVDACVYKKEIK